MKRKRRLSPDMLILVQIGKRAVFDLQNSDSIAVEGIQTIPQYLEDRQLSILKAFNFLEQD